MMKTFFSTDSTRFTLRQIYDLADSVEEQDHKQNLYNGGNETLRQSCHKHGLIGSACLKASPEAVQEK